MNTFLWGLLALCLIAAIAFGVWVGVFKSLGKKLGAGTTGSKAGTESTNDQP